MKTMYNKIVFVSASLSSGGGIAALMQHYRKILPVFHHISSVSDKVVPILKYVYVVYAMLWLWIYRVFCGMQLVHFHGASYSSYRRKYLLSRWAKFLGYRTIFHLHGGDFLGFHQAIGADYLTRTLNMYDAVAVLSEYWKKYLVDNFACSNVYVIKNIVDVPKLASLTDSNASSMFNILYMGALYKDKGAYDLLSFAQKYHSDFQNKLTIHICGGKTDSELRAFKKALDKVKDNKIISFHGWIESEKKVYFLQHCDALILPSYYEGLPMCILEAMSYAKPIIATPVGSIPELVVPGKTGYLFEPGNIEQMFNCISELMQSQSNAKQMGKMGSKIVSQFYPKNVRTQLDALYSSFFI